MAPLKRANATPTKHMKSLNNDKSINKSKILINKFPKGRAKAQPISHMDKVGIKQIPQTKKHRWITLLETVLPNVNVLNGRSREENLDRMRDLVSSHLKNHGEIESIKRLKLLRLVTQQYCLKQEVSIIPYCKTEDKIST